MRRINKGKERVDKEGRGGGEAAGVACGLAMPRRAQRDFAVDLLS